MELSTAFDSEVPLIQDVNYNTYLNFNKDVEHYLTGLKIRLARRSKNYSIKLDGATKTKLRHHIEQMLGIIDKLEVTQRKKETLFDKLNNFAAEVDRDRTRIESYGALAVEAAEVFGEAAEKAEPARKWLDTIGRVLWGAKEKENETKQLPPPKEPKRIEPPKKKGRGDDDEIPF